MIWSNFNEQDKLALKHQHKHFIANITYCSSVCSERSAVAAVKFDKDLVMPKCYCLRMSQYLPLICYAHLEYIKTKETAFPPAKVFLALKSRNSTRYTEGSICCGSLRVIEK